MQSDNNSAEVLDTKNQTNERYHPAILTNTGNGNVDHPEPVKSGRKVDGESSSKEDKYTRHINPPQVSSQVPSIVKVPTQSRAGILAQLSLVYEAEEPKRYPRGIKWLITFWVSVAAMVAPMGSSIILPALTDIAQDFSSSSTITNLSVAIYMLAMSIFPLWWSSFSESSGRRSVYIVSFTLFVIFNILAAVSTSISMFIVFRLMSGGSSAAVQAVGAGTIADIWDVHERGRAMGIFYLGPLCGPLFSPVLGGALSQGFGWRSTQWFQVIFGAIIVAGILVCLPETHIHSAAVVLSRTTPQSDSVDKGEHSLHAQPLTSRFINIKSRTYLEFGHRMFIEPLKIIRYLRYPPVLLTVLYASIAFGSLYFLNISIERTFSRPPYSFSTTVVGCLYMFNSVGYIIASILGGPWVDYIMAREAHKAGRFDVRGKPILVPEDRMRENVWVAALCMPAALTWYGWTSHFEVHFLAPMAANFVFGGGSMLLFGAATTMLTEMMPGRASNGVALNNFVRNVFAFLATFLADPLIRAIGNGWLFTILGLIATLAAITIPLMHRKGEKWRQEMDTGLKLSR